jgi:hypothetical protein
VPAWPALALELAEPRARAAIAVAVQADVVDDVAAVDREVVAPGIDCGEAPHPVLRQQLAGADQARGCSASTWSRSNGNSRWK